MCERPGAAARPSVLLISVQEDLEVLGLKYVHAALLAAGFRSKLLFLPGGLGGHRTARSEVAAFARRAAPLFAGISAMAVEADAAREVTALLREVLRVPIVWGGIHPTVAPADCLGDADLVCRGEGERAAVALAETLEAGGDPRSVANLAYLGPDGVVVSNPLNPLECDLDALASIDHLPHSSFVLDRGRVAPLTRALLRRYSRYGGSVLSVLTSRGCPFGCTYCCNRRLTELYGTRRIRRRGNELVIAELTRALRRHPEIKFVHFHDDSFLTARMSGLEHFCRLYAARVRRPFFAKAVPSEVTPRALAALKAAGIAWLNIGLQSGSDRVLREVYERNTTRADFLRAAAQVKAAGIAPWYDVILDNPFETDDDRLATALTLARTPGPFYLKLFSLALYPGTTLHERAAAQGVAIEDARRKDYSVYSPDRLNTLIRLAAFLPSEWTTRLVRQHRNGGHGVTSGLALLAARIVSAAFIEPAVYWRLARLSRRGSVTAALASLPVYARDGLRRFRLGSRQVLRGWGGAT